MRKVLTSEQMREVDRLSTETFGIPSIVLMENAARSVANIVCENLESTVAERKKVMVLAGKGNNGGDGSAVARMLIDVGIQVDFLLFGRSGDLLGDARLNFDILSQMQKTSSDLQIHEDNGRLTQILATQLSDDPPDIIVDALFGTGLTRSLDEKFSETVRLINAADQKIISVDIPSGLDADRSDVIGPTISAFATVTFTAPKFANSMPPASRLCGKLSVAAIGSPAELINKQPSQLYVTEPADVKQWLHATAFSADSYKNKRGGAFVVAGSADYSGAAVLCGNAAIRTGVGLVTLAVPEICKTEVASRALPEVIVKEIDCDAGGNIDVNALAHLTPQIERANAIVIGCGMSTTDTGVRRLTAEIVNGRKSPVIVDAGALSFFSEFKQSHGDRPPIILTPHEGEFRMLLATESIVDSMDDRIAAVRSFARRNNVILVLKGERVLIGEPSGRVVINSTGNSGLGKAGNGDTLAGAIGGFAAQGAAFGVDIFETVIAAIFFAGHAGDISRQKYGERVMTASDVRESFAEAFKELAA